MQAVFQATVMGFRCMVVSMNEEIQTCFRKVIKPVFVFFYFQEFLSLSCKLNSPHVFQKWSYTSLGTDNSRAFLPSSIVHDSQHGEGLAKTSLCL